MSFIFSQALVEAFSLGSCLDIEQSAPSSGSLTLKPCLWHDRTMEPSRLSRFGMTCKPLTESRGAELLTLWLEGFRAKTSALQETERDLTENAAECGTTWPASLAKFDPDTSSWKTAQLSLLGGLEEFSETWPRWGLMRAGECWERQTLAPRTSESGSGLWPTPQAMLATSDLNFRCSGDGREKPNKLGWAVAERTWPTPTVCGNYNSKGASATSGDGLATAVATSLTMSDLVSTDAPIAKAKMYPTATATAYKGWSPKHNRADTDDRLDYTVEREAFNPGQQTPPMRLNPAWVEWLMGWPIGHTELKPLETDKFREWQQQHSDC